MASKNNILKIFIVGDDSDAKRAFKSTGDEAQNFGQKTNTAFAVAGGAAVGFLAAGGVQAVTGFFGNAIGLASDMGETLSKNKTIFGEAANELIAWAENAPKAMGMTQQAALDATGSLGNMFTQLGLGVDQAREMSKANVQLAADFGSFHNADSVEVMNAMSSAYRGEYDAVQRFVPLINAAAVDQKAYQMTKKDFTQELTQQDKAMAVHALMMEGAGAAVGDFARTSESASNQSKTMSAQWEQMQTQIGERLIPAFIAVQSFLLNDLIPAFVTIGQFVNENKEYFLALGIGIMVTLVPAFIAWAVSAGTAAVATIVAAAPVIALGAVVAALVVGVIWAYQNIDVFRTVMQAFGSAVQWVWGWISDNWRTLLAVLTGPIGIAVSVIMNNWSTIAGGVVWLYNTITHHFDVLVGFVSGLGSRIWSAASGMWDSVYDGFRSMINSVVGAWNNLDFTVPGIDVGPIHFGGQTVGTPDLPYLAQGGIVPATPGGRLAVIGEGGEDEAVIPLSKLDGRGGTTIINIEFNSYLPANKRQAGRIMEEIARTYDRATGTR